MEKWQRKYITENLPELIQNVNCDTLFLSYLCKFGVLGDGDMKKLDAKGILGGQHDKTKCLLDILATRTGTYQQLAKALYSSKQTGALLILLHGIEKAVPDLGPFEFCGIELSIEDKIGLFNRKVMFQGAMVPLKDICKFLDDSSLTKNITCHLDVSSYQQFIKNKPVTLATETIPESLPYYIPRTLTINTQLDPVVFSKLESDIVCIENIELHQLSSLAKSGIRSTTGRMSQSVDKSRNQIHRPTARFILLENRDHFQDISVKTKKVVHWIQHERGNFVYVKSSSGSGVKMIQDFLKYDGQETVSEDEFTEKLIAAATCQPILLYDSPGMGKSVLLAQMARKIKEIRPERNVMYFQLNDFIHKVSRPNGNCTSSDMKQNLAKLVATSSLGESILRNLMNTDNHRVELFLDGYDEIPESYISAADSILDCISKECKNIRMWVTTRPHRRHELEEKFGVLGYNIMPFNDSNKISFFLKYWQDQHGISPTEDIQLFGEHCLKNLKMTVSENDLAGIPLQCKMLAEIFAEKAKRGGLVCSESRLQFNSVYQMYKEFMETKFANLEMDSTIRALKNYHVKAAIRTLFSKEVVIADEASDGVDMTAVFRLGILESSKSDLGEATFVHRTFAEILAAEHLATCVIIKSPRTSDKMIKETTYLIFETALAAKHDVCFKLLVRSQVNCIFIHHVVVQFIDFFLGDLHTTTQDLKQLKDCLRASKYYNLRTLVELLVALLKLDAIHLFAFLLDVYLDFGESGDYTDNSNVLSYPPRPMEACQAVQELFHDLRKEWDSECLVVTAAFCSSLELVKRTLEFLERATGKQWHDFDYGKNASPLRASLLRGHYQIFEYLLNFNWDMHCKKPLLHWCLEDSENNSAEVIADKVQIIKRILQQGPELLNKPHPEYNYPPILTDCDHVELICCLIEAGAQLTPTDVLGYNIAHYAAFNNSADKFHQLMTTLISRNANDIFRQPDSNGLTAVHFALMGTELKTETLELLAAQFEIDFNDNNNSMGKSELAWGIEMGRSERVQNDILRLGGRKNKMYKKRCSLQ